MAGPLSRRHSLGFARGPEKCDHFDSTALLSGEAQSGNGRPYRDPHSEWNVTCEGATQLGQTTGMGAEPSVPSYAECPVLDHLANRLVAANAAAPASLRDKLSVC